jgi:hypothetical protein
LAYRIDFFVGFSIFLKVNVGLSMLPKTDQKTSQNYWVSHVLDGNGFYKVCEKAWGWPLKSFRNPGNIALEHLESAHGNRVKEP